MGTATKIEWTDNTFNPWRGCAKVHTGCANCYAEREAKRFASNRGVWGVNGTRVLASEAIWREPFKWNREAEKAGENTRVFCASLADIFEDWPGQLQNTKGELLWFHSPEPPGGYGGKLFRSHSVPVSKEGSLIPNPHESFEPSTLNAVRGDLFDLIDRTPFLTWQILTKRPENIRRMWPTFALMPQYQRAQHAIASGGDHVAMSVDPTPRRTNVHLLYSASDQQSFDSGCAHIIGCGDLVPVIGLSLEPLVGPIVIPSELLQPIQGTSQHGKRFIDWVIVGGESGPHARPCNIEWIRSIVAQCKAAGVACFVKQLGSNIEDGYLQAEKWMKLGAREIVGMAGKTFVKLQDTKGGDWNQWPEDLRVREMPEVPRV